MKTALIVGCGFNYPKVCEKASGMISIKTTSSSIDESEFARYPNRL